MKNKAYLSGKVFIVFAFLFLLFGCNDEKKEEIKRAEEMGLGKQLKHEFFKGEDGKECEGDLNYNWEDKKELKMEIKTNIGSRGSEFVDTRVYQNGNTLHVFVLEKFCENDCPGESKEQCSEFLVKGIKKGDFNIEIHRSEEITSGAVIKKMKVSGDQEE